WVKQHGLKNAPCYSLIAKHDVQLLQMEKPEVSEEELIQAVSWKIKDLISYDVESAVVDTYQLPPSPKNPANTINAVVANENTVAGYVDSIKQSGMDLQVIDIHELAARNLLNAHQLSEQATALLQISDHESLVSIYRDQDLYVSRDFKIGLLNIDNQDSADESLYDSILLEIQRSMDYYESSYGLGNIQKLLVYPQLPATERMLKYLHNYVAYDLDFIEPDLFQQQSSLEAMDTHCFAAYCAALRGAFA
ncbi:MAG: pilus assembly protein PilM, partial [Gammaproteobacteria bacterium]|nr:pilus assembly protein PilM [Gammaproteobacteria bacterium]